MPYVLNSIPDNKEAFMAVISLGFMVDAINREFQALIEASLSVLNPLDFLASVKLLLRIAYIIGLIILLIALIKRIVNLIIQPVKYHDCMRVKRLCEIGAEHFGFTFESSILNNDQFKNLVILPEKFSHDVNTISNLTGDDDILGFFTPNNPESRGYYNGTFGELLRGLKEMWNAKIIIDGTILRLEREDFNNSAFNYKLPPVDQTSFTVNSSDLKSNYVIKFLTDINDKQTLQNYKGTLTQITHTPLRPIINKDMLLMRGLEERVIPFARATTKLTLTSPEKIINSIAPIFDPIASSISNIVDAILSVVDEILNNKLLSAAALLRLVGVVGYAIIAVIINKATFTIADVLDWFNDNIYDTGLDLSVIPRIDYQPIGELIEKRTGMLLMENDMVEVPKMFIIREDTNDPISTDIDIDNGAIINTDFLENEYHLIRNFVLTDKRPNGNQYKIYSAENVAFCQDDYELLRDSNFMQDDLGRDGELISCRWNIEKETASIEYKINEHYTDNLQIDIITPNGK
jgi:hypothetical protein